MVITRRSFLQAGIGAAISIPLRHRGLPHRRGLPPGLHLSRDGRISGVPDCRPGIYSFTVTVTDSAGQAASKALSIVVQGREW